MKKISGILVMSLLALALSASALLAKDMGLAPHFTLEDVQGNKISLASYRNGAPALLFFWTTWCPFCRKELTALNKKYTDLINIGWKVLAIDVGESASRVTDFTKNTPLVFSVLLDRDTAVSYLYDVLGVPTYVLINKEGKVVFRDNYFPDNYKELLPK